MKIAVTGVTGLIGSRFFDLLKSRFEIIPISSSYGMDITDRNKITKFLKAKNPAVIVHFAAKTNVDSCEKDREEDIEKLNKNKVYDNGKIDFENLDADSWKGSSSSFGINVVGTKNLADFSKNHGSKMVYISTDFVFDGEKNGFYTEEDKPSPVNWYGQTKLWGEEALQEGSIITRISYPFGHKSLIKKDLIWTLVGLISQQDEVSLVSDQVITPTFIDDIVLGIEFLIKQNSSGIFNLVGNNSFSPYEIGVILAREFGYSETKIELTTRAKLYAGRAKRPFKVMLKNDKLKHDGYSMTDFFEALKKIK